MPDRISPGVIRAQVVFQGVTNLPEDRFVNNFYFSTAIPGQFPVEADYANIATRLPAFYNTGGPSGHRIAEYMSSEILKTTNSAQIRMYHLGEEKPRELHVVNWTLTTATDSARLPHEVAVVASFYATRNIPRRRGRVYIGPLNLSALNQITGRPQDAMRVSIIEAMDSLSFAAGGNEWVTYSTVLVGGAFHEVTNGWCDNAFDTQRRRGVAGTSRTVFSRGATELEQTELERERAELSKPVQLPDGYWYGPTPLTE
jgi:hypothetical protein